MAPKEARDWVDYQMNCEDIFMNYIVTNATHKAPVKVTARKFFKSPTESVFQSLSLHKKTIENTEMNRNLFRQKKAI